MNLNQFCEKYKMSVSSVRTYIERPELRHHKQKVGITFYIREPEELYKKITAFMSKRYGGNALTIHFNSAKTA